MSKSLVFSLLLILISAKAFSQGSNLQYLEGSWYINRSNFPMWLSGKKTEPTFNYTLQKKSGKYRLLDEVKFFKNGKEKSIVGFDYPIERSPAQFVWRGKGLLFIAKSKWAVLHYDEQLLWMLIKFEKTLFTPPGYDIVSRERHLSAEQREEIQKIMSQLDIKATLSEITQNPF